MTQKYQNYIFLPIFGLYIATAENSSLLSNVQTIDSINEVLNLLNSWGLPQLCSKFKEHDVCLVALQYLTDNDVIELIPKIGPRAIFRARLIEWLKRTPANIKIEAVRSNLEWYREEDDDATPSGSNSISAEQLNHEPEVELRTEVEWAENGSTNAPNFNGALTKKEIKREMLESTQKFNVKDLITKNQDGRNAVEYYKTYNYLDYNNRKKVVKIIISAMIEHSIVMSTNCFQDLAQQVVNFFPKENYNTYYVPRTGNTCPRGALYNKYLNMTRRLRSAGKLDYRVKRRLLRSNQ